MAKLVFWVSHVDVFKFRRPCFVHLNAIGLQQSGLDLMCHGEQRHSMAGVKFRHQLAMVLTLHCGHHPIRFRDRKKLIRFFKNRLSLYKPGDAVVDVVRFHSQTTILLDGSYKRAQIKPERVVGRHLIASSLARFGERGHLSFAQQNLE